jgi:hypothetical protein
MDQLDNSVKKNKATHESFFDTVILPGIEFDYLNIQLLPITCYKWGLSLSTLKSRKKGFKNS